MYKSERWAPLPIPVDVFLIALETTENLKTLLGATSVHVAYNKGGTILIEWTMMHRETFAGFVGQYIIRKSSGEFVILDADELMNTYAPFVEPKAEDEGYYNGMDKLGKITAVYEHDGAIEEILFELPNGSPATFVLKTPEEVKTAAETLLEVIKLEENQNNKGRPIPGPPKNHNKEKTDE